jgi:hypothetical protein
VQVDPIKPTLKGAGTKRLKLKHFELLSNFPFEVNLRRYTQVGGGGARGAGGGGRGGGGG